MSTDYWTTKAGEEIKFTDLTDTHLLNILHAIQNGKIKCVKKEREVIVQDNGDDWETCLSEASSEETKEYLNFNGLLEEAKKRNLDVKDYELA